jgi:hypothetical protein
LIGVADAGDLARHAELLTDLVRLVANCLENRWQKERLDWPQSGRGRIYACGGGQWGGLSNRGTLGLCRDPRTAPGRLSGKAVGGRDRVEAGLWGAAGRRGNDG